MGWGISALLALFLVWPLSVAAVSVTLSNPPSDLACDQETEVEVHLECRNCAASYLRAVLYRTGNQYFGLTQNRLGEWIGASSDKTRYYLVAPEDFLDSTWSGRLKFKPEPESSDYEGPGSYQFKIGRYTAGGSVTWSDSLAVNLHGPVPTAPPSPTPKATPVPTLAPRPTSVPPSPQVLAATAVPSLPPVSPSPSLSLSLSPTHSPSPTPPPDPSPAVWPGFVVSVSGVALMVFAVVRFFRPIPD